MSSSDNRRASVLAAAIIRIQTVWRNRLRLWRARELRESTLANACIDEQNAFHQIAPTRQSTRDRAWLTQQQTKRRAVTIATKTSQRYDDNDGSSSHCTPSSFEHVVPQETSPMSSASPLIAPTSRTTKSKSGTLSFHTAAIIIQLFCRARLKFRRLRAARRSSDVDFLNWESDAYAQQRAHIPRRHLSIDERRHQAGKHSSGSMSDSRTPTAPPIAETHNDIDNATSHELETLAGKLAILDANIVASTSLTEAHQLAFDALVQEVRNIVKRAADPRSSRFELIADTATDLCIDIQRHMNEKSRSVAASEISIHAVEAAIRASQERDNQPADQPTVVTPPIEAIHAEGGVGDSSLTRRLSASQSREAREPSNDFHPGIANAVQRAALLEIEIEEEETRNELIARCAAKVLVALTSFVEGTLIWLLEREATSRDSVARSQTAARNVLLDIFRMSELSVLQRGNAAITIQCWLRCSRARRVRKIITARRDRTLLQRIAAETAPNDEDDEEESQQQRQTDEALNASIGAFAFVHIGDHCAEDVSPQNNNHSNKGTTPTSPKPQLSSSRASSTTVHSTTSHHHNDEEVMDIKMEASFSNHLNAITRTVAATNIQKIVRGRQTRKSMDVLINNVMTRLENSEMEHEQTAAVRVIVRLFRYRAAQFRRALRQASTNIFVDYAAAADATFEEYTTQTEEAHHVLVVALSAASQHCIDKAVVVQQPIATAVTPPPETPDVPIDDDDDVVEDTPASVFAVEHPPAAAPATRAQSVTGLTAVKSVPVPPQLSTTTAKTQPPIQPQRPESARTTSSRARPQTAPRRPTTATTKRLSSAAEHQAPYVDQNHDSRTALRTLTSTPLCNTLAQRRAVDGMYVLGHLATSPDGIDIASAGDVVDNSPFRPLQNSHSMDGASPEEDMPAQHLYMGGSQSPDDSRQGEYLNYVGMLETLKAEVVKVLVEHCPSLSQDAAMVNITGMMYSDLLDVLLARRGTSPSVKPQEEHEVRKVRASVVAAVSFDDVPVVEIAGAGASRITHPLEFSNRGELSDLWNSETFVDRVVQRLNILAPQQQQPIASHTFCLDEIAIAILSSIDTVVTDDDQLGYEITPSKVATQQSRSSGLVGMALVHGQPVALRAEFEAFCSVFANTCLNVAEERRTTDAATIAACFSILDIQGRRLIPRALFDQVFKLRIGLASSHHGAIPFMAFAKVLRRNILQSTMTLQRIMGTFYDKVLLKGASELEHSNRLKSTSSIEERLRTYSVDILDVIASVGERSGASLADALVLYTSLLSPSAMTTIRWFVLSLMGTLVERLSVLSTKEYATLRSVVMHLNNHSYVTTPATSGPDVSQEKWEELLRAFAVFIESSAFAEVLRSQRLCDGAAARRNAYRVSASVTEEIDRCVPWTTFALPCMDSLSYFATQRVSFDDSLTKMIPIDNMGHIRRAENGVVVDEASSANNKMQFFATSASGHIDGFEERRRQLNTLLYSLRHYAICLSDVFELQYMSRAIPHFPLPHPRATTVSSSQHQLVHALSLHPDFTPAFPLRIQAEPKASRKFTNRFAKMLFSLSVQSNDGPNTEWFQSSRNHLLSGNREDGAQSPIQHLRRDVASPAMPFAATPLSSNTTPGGGGVAAASTTNSRPTTATSRTGGSASSPHSRARPATNDLCSPPSRSSRPHSAVSPAPLTPRIVTSRPLPAVVQSTTPQVAPYFTAPGKQSSPRASTTVAEQQPGRRTVLLDSIMNSFPGVPSFDKPSAAMTTPSVRGGSTVVPVPPEPRPPGQRGVYPMFRSGRNV